jgi:hypothetical protein
MPRSNVYAVTSPIKFSLFFIFAVLSFSSQAANGPSVNELRESLNSTWNTLLKVTNCDRPPPQDSICMQEHNGKTIAVRLYGQQVNMLILFETTTTSNVSGPVYTQQTGFLIGPIDGYGYKVVNEQQAHGVYQKRQIVDNDLKVFAHPVAGQNISSQGIELNKGQNWLDGKYEPWWQHWAALAKAEDSLKELKRYLDLNY